MTSTGLTAQARGAVLATTQPSMPVPFLVLVHTPFLPAAGYWPHLTPSGPL